LIILVLNNRDLNMVTWEERVLAGDPRFPASQSVPDFPYAEYAKSLGLDGVRVDRADDIAGAWERAFASTKPFVFEAVTDPNVPPLPPHITLEQAKAFTSSVLKGDAERLGFLKQTVKEVADKYLPNRK
jgi:pyruvate dehydrogenase (quinone)